MSVCCCPFDDAETIVLGTRPQMNAVVPLWAHLTSGAARWCAAAAVM
jgi:hypothetical protein